jgi:drug/metabolite transporter (DMT)-like permease
LTEPPTLILKLDRASVWMIGGAFLLATMGALSHSIGQRCDWYIIALFRAFMMLVTATILVKSSGADLVFWKPRTLWVRSLAGSFSLVCNFFALTHLHVADAITLMNMQPLWIVMISALILWRRPTPTEFLGVACGLAGVFLIESPQLEGNRLAVFVALMSSASSAVAMLGLHRLRQVDPRAIVAHFAGVATLVSAVCLCFAWRSGSPIRFEAGGSLFGLLIAIGASGTLGQILLTKAYAVGSPTKVATVGLIQVVFGMIFEVTLWNRQLTPITLLGFVLVLAPTTWLSLRSARAGKPTEARPLEPAIRD